MVRFVCKFNFNDDLLRASLWKYKHTLKESRKDIFVGYIIGTFLLVFVSNTTSQMTLYVYLPPQHVFRGPERYTVEIPGLGALIMMTIL